MDTDLVGVLLFLDDNYIIPHHRKYVRIIQQSFHFTGTSCTTVRATNCKCRFVCSTLVCNSLIQQNDEDYGQALQFKIDKRLVGERIFQALVAGTHSSH